MSDVGAVGAYPKTVVLTDGTHLVLRLGGPGDAPVLAALARRVAPELRWEPADDPVVAGPGTGPARILTVVACDTARVVAGATLARPAEPRDGRPRHVASLAVRIDPAYRGLRLGTWMLLDCVHLAAALDIELLVALAHPEDDAYLAALRRLDFVDDATLRDRHHVPDGRARGLALLVKSVHRRWTDF